MFFMFQQFAVEHELMYIPSLASSGGRVGQQDKNFLLLNFDVAGPFAAHVLIGVAYTDGQRSRSLGSFS